MGVLASQAGDRAGDLANGFFKAIGQIEQLASRGIEDRRNRPAQGLVLRIPEFNGKRSLVATEDWRRGDCRARVAFDGLQSKPRDGQFVGVADA